MSGWRTIDLGAFDDVVLDVAVHGRGGLGQPALDLAEEAQQPLGVVALGESLAVHDVALEQDPVGVQEAVGRHEVDLRMVGPTGQQRLEDAGERALADSDTAGDADHVGHLRAERAEERGRHLLQVLGRGHVQVQEAGQWQVHDGDLFEVDAVVDAAQLGQVVLAQRQRCRRAQQPPVVAHERQVPTVPGRGRRRHERQRYARSAPPRQRHAA